MTDTPPSTEEMQAEVQRLKNLNEAMEVLLDVRLRTMSMQLRKDHVVKVSGLPPDLTKAEALRIAAWIMLMAEEIEP